MSELLVAYLEKLQPPLARNAGTPETSLYPALHWVLSEIGLRLTPKVFCIQHPADTGAGVPDYGLFTQSQLRDAREGEIVPSGKPERGVIEAKPPRTELSRIADLAQVGRYFDHYGLVLCTNFWSFKLVGRDQFGRRIDLEHFALATDADEFLALVQHPQRADKFLRLRFEAFIERTLLMNATLSDPRDVAWFLASYARDAAIKIEARGGPRNLETLENTLEKLLGLSFDGPKGAHFFRSTLVQTLFYGLFSAWVIWCRNEPDPAKRKDFSADSAHWLLRAPILQSLFQAIWAPETVGSPDLREAMEQATAALRRTDDRAFFQRFALEDAVQYFYEPFLEAFDPELKKELGVWYTPPEVVEYMVEKVDRALRDQLGIADGLADPDVYVLDPCCGTGSFPLAILKRIEKTLRDKSGGGDALIGADLKRAAVDRIAGFELLPAPYVIAMMQMSLAIEAAGGRFQDGAHSSRPFEQPAIFLTNALIGWESGRSIDPLGLFAQLLTERRAADRFKRDKSVLVVIGNPPYNVFADVTVEEERDLSNAYRTVKNVRKPEGHGLNDLYVRFFRMAERRIAEMTQRGVVAYITNYSWLDGLSFPGMRERFLAAFDDIAIDVLNGDKFKTGKRTPDGKSDPSIFSTERTPEGIQVGTAIATLVKRGPTNVGKTPAKVQVRQFWGAGKRAALAAIAANGDGPQYTTLVPRAELGLPFTSTDANPAYADWPLLTDIMPTRFPGVKTSRDDAVVDMDRESLVARMKRYFDKNLTDAQVAAYEPSMMAETPTFSGSKIRHKHLQALGLQENSIVPYLYRPFDRRYLYWDTQGGLLDRPRSGMREEISKTNFWLSSGQRNRKDDFYAPSVTRCVSDHHVVESNSQMFPQHRILDESGLGVHGTWIDFNLTDKIRRNYALSSDMCADIFPHIVALLHSPSYRHENKAVLRLDWPRIPLPDESKILAASAALGRRAMALLDPDADADAELAMLPGFVGRLARAGGGQLGEDELAVTARWGFAGKDGATMAGKGRAPARAWSSGELSELSPAMRAAWGDGTRDLYLNDVALVGCVPEKVFGYTLGGYQVVKKWLSYRERDLLGRALTPAEARTLCDIVRRIAGLLLLGPELDANYAACASSARPIAGWAKNRR